jgi:RNA ligase (TIGR02306 family)
MSTFKVFLTKIKEVLPHPNAKRLEIAKVYDWEVIIGKDQYKVGDIVLYVPVGSVLSEQLETILFPPDSKVRLTKRRIRAIKLRGVVSQGFLINPIHLGVTDNLESLLEQDFAKDLGIEKYTEPVKSTPKLMQAHQIKNIYKNPEFKQYTDVEHGKYYDRQVMTTGEEVIVTQKLHGTSARYGWFIRPQRTWLDKVRAFFKILPEWEFCWGSRRCQINSKPEKSHDGFKSEAQGVDFGDVYTKIKKQEKLEKLLPKGYAVYGEIVGWGIQKGYLYNCGLNQHKFYVYDVMKDGKWLDYDEAVKFCEEIGLTHVQLMYRGPFVIDNIKPFLEKNPISNEINEGVCVKPVVDRHSPLMGRVVLKYINPEYLLKFQ